MSLPAWKQKLYDMAAELIISTPEDTTLVCESASFKRVEARRLPSGEWETRVERSKSLNDFNPGKDTALVEVRGVEDVVDIIFRLMVARKIVTVTYFDGAGQLLETRTFVRNPPRENGGSRS